MSRRTHLPLSLLLFYVSACAEAGEEPASPDDIYGMDGPVEPTPAPGKEDSQNRRGLLVATDTSRTQVWTARNKWEDTDTPAARKAGLAWDENSGLNWDEKYAAWIQSMERTRGVEGFDTFTLTTPWGKSLESPSLECAELSLFLRITFAAWYELPFFLEAVDSSGTRIYFGHNGVRTASGRYVNTPEYALVYKDYSSRSLAEVQASWPKDTALRTRVLAGGTDEQRMLGDGAVTGTYADEIHLNKRAGHFILLTLNYLGSANLADSANTYNLVPEAVRPGDSLLERWQRVGIGHTLVVKDVTELGEGNLDVALVSASMPRRQGKWESGVVSKGYFTDERTGGEGTSFDGDEYAKLGGGLKRWRVTKNVGGYWTNTWMNGDEAHWINSTDYARIAARPARFEQLLGQIAPEDARDGLLQSIEDARGHLRNFPASCAARERRERAFGELYDLMEREFGDTHAEVDRRFRHQDDYVLGELEYTQSKTCCWNSSSAAMYQIIADFAAQELADAEEEGVCRAPTVFKSQSDGYERWRDFAADSGRGALWKAWSEDEPCAQRNVASDTERARQAIDFCELGDDGGGGGGGSCSDAREPNEQPTGAPSLSSGADEDLRICAGDSDWFTLPAGGVVHIGFSHATGDLDMTAHDSAGNQVGSSAGTGDSEEVTVPAGGRVHIFGYQGATGAYRLTVD